jgi:excisionase family DNA binding protein
MAKERDEMISDEFTDEELLTVGQVGEWLKVDPRYVYQLAKSGELASTRFGRYVRIPADAVRAFIAVHTAEAEPVKSKPRARRPRARAHGHLRVVRNGER